MAILPLPEQSVLLKRYVYDPKTGILTHRTKKKCANIGDVAGHDRGGGYLCTSIGNRLYAVHRIIWKMVTGEEPDHIDHDDRNRSNNRWGNLKSVPEATNHKNYSKVRSNKTGVTGVCWDTGRGAWRATIGVGGRNRFLGHFDDFDAAVARRQTAEIEAGYHPNHGR